MSRLTVLNCQIEIPETRNRADRDRHLEILTAKIDQRLSEKPADLVVLPELSCIEYSRPAFDRLAELSDPLEGECLSHFAGIARRNNVHIVFGLPRRDKDRYFISMVAIDPSGQMIGHYDKIHIAQYGASFEKEYFQRGSHLFVLEINGFRIAPIICYDIRIPELTRTLCVDHDVQLILHCGAYARDESFYSWHHFAVTRAMENLCFLVSISRAGSFFGGSIICSPWVDEDHPPVLFGTDEEFRYADFELDELKKIRSTYPFILDRLSDYQSLPVHEARCVERNTDN